MEQPRKAVVVTGTLMAAAVTATAGRGGWGGSRAGGVGRGAVAREGQVLEVVPGLEDVIAQFSPRNT